MGGYCSGSRPSRMRRLRRCPTMRARRWPFSKAPAGLAAKALSASSPKKVSASLRNRSEEAATAARAFPGYRSSRQRRHRSRASPVAASSAAHLATSEVFPSPPSATKVRTCGRWVSARRTLSPRVMEEFRLVLPTDEFRRRILDDAGDVDSGAPRGCAA